MARIFIIGAGHNGLVAACYLAKAGHEVTVYEQSARIGGLCVNEEFWPGFVSSSWANWYGMLRPEIIEDLGFEFETLLDKHGGVTLTHGGGCAAGDALFIDGLDAADIEGVERFQRAFATASSLLRKYFLADDPRRDDFVRELAAADFPMDAETFLSSSLLDVAGRFVRNPDLHAMLGSNTFLHPAHPGSAFGYVVMETAQACGEDGSWGFVRGGMGVITQALYQKALALGVGFVIDTTVERIIHDNGVVSGLLINGGVARADYYACGTDYTVLQRLLGRPAESEMRSNLYGHGNIHCRLSRLPTFPLLEKHGLADAATFSIIPPIAAIRSNHAHYLSGEAMDMPVISIAFPTVVDAGRAPPGKHLMCLHPDHVPLRLNEDGWDQAGKERYMASLLDYLEHYAPDIRDCIEDWIMLSPQDMRNRYGAEGMHCFHGDLSWEFAMDRRMPGYGAGPRTDIENLYLCGSACHPGGTVSGAPGYRCAKRMIDDLS